MGKGKIFVRERLQINEGDKKPRFAVVGVTGMDLKIYVSHIRKSEIEQIAAETDADVVYLKATKEEKETNVDD